MKSEERGQGHIIEDIFSTISVSARTMLFYKSKQKKFLEKNDYIRLDEISETEKEIEKVKERITRLQDQFMDGNITPEDFSSMKQRTENTLTGLQLKLKNLRQTTSPFKTFINK